ncbi:hypothetical protein [Sphingomonas sp. Leaf25]|uniref:hypothetical protein n=1 Tax=Sphingomonas sp. Leaf25 TaxID=1735692 RepID=UPI0006F5985B|nr:hypothetical protein [Sphingomonas sp. Leaf25]KQN00541.1 hypothetical protein ASE78_05500 [Sphingomonas sp. Leaf25]
MIAGHATGDAPRLSLGPDDTPPDDGRMAAKLRAVRLAAKCFDIARSSRFEGERDAAISRGIAIAKKAGLRLELFNIPGWDESCLRDALAAAADTQERWASALRVADDETIYDAKRRAFDEAASAAAERDRQAGRRAGAALDREALRKAELLDRWPTVHAAINALRARQVKAEVGDDILRPTTRVWFVSGWGVTPFDEWQLREKADEVCG